MKAETALSVTNETLALASEGTFGPHPSNPFVPCNREIVILLDKTNEIEIIGQAISIETNFNHSIIKNIQEAHEFAEKAGFPEHALVVMVHPSPKNQEEIIKGINTTEQLVEAVTFALKRSETGKISIETDMRALYNPTRMTNIVRATRDLINKIQNTCPNCDFPGFDVFSRKIGLPCAYCHSPTEITLAVTINVKNVIFERCDVSRWNTTSRSFFMSLLQSLRSISSRSLCKSLMPCSRALDFKSAIYTHMNILP